MKCKFYSAILINYNLHKQINVSGLVKITRINGLANGKLETSLNWEGCQHLIIIRKWSRQWVFQSATIKESKPRKYVQQILFQLNYCEPFTTYFLTFNFYYLAFGKTSRSLSVVNAANSGRKALKEGLEMLEARYLQKDSI